eukprot:m.146971 g.146971  ORF g.146971 m.146971 type:complete len:70 (+) comp14169_c0_seq2:305-514(+)
MRFELVNTTLMRRRPTKTCLTAQGLVTSSSRSSPIFSLREYIVRVPAHSTVAVCSHTPWEGDLGTTSVD